MCSRSNAQELSAATAQWLLQPAQSPQNSHQLHLKLHPPHLLLSCRPPPHFLPPPPHRTSSPRMQRNLMERNGPALEIHVRWFLIYPSRDLSALSHGKAGRRSILLGQLNGWPKIMRRWILHGQLSQVKCSFRPGFPENRSLTVCMIIKAKAGPPFLHHHQTYKVDSVRSGTNCGDFGCGVWGTDFW